MCDRLRPAVVFLRPAVLFSLTRRMTSEPKKPHSRQTAPELLLIAPYWSPLVSVLADVNTELPPSLAGRLRSRCNQAVHVCARGYQTAELGGCVTSPNSCSVSRLIPVTKPTCSHSVSASCQCRLIADHWGDTNAKAHSLLSCVCICLVGRVCVCLDASHSCLLKASFLPVNERPSLCRAPASILLDNAPSYL